MIKAEKDFEALKDTPLPLLIWYQDRFAQHWKSGKLILQGKGYACISPDGTNEISWLPLQKILPRELPAFKIEKKWQNAQEEESLAQAMATLKIYNKRRTRRHRRYDLPA